MQENFNAEAGFVQRTGIRTTKGHFSPTPRPTKGNVKLFEPMYVLTYTTDQDNRLIYRQHHPMLGTTLRDDTFINVFYQNTLDVLDVPFRIRPNVTIPVGAYSMNELYFTVNTSPGRRLYERVTVSPVRVLRRHAAQPVGGGGHPRVEPPFGGDAYNRNDVKMPWGDFLVNLSTLRVDYTFTPRMTIRSLTQYNDSTHEISNNVRFNFIYRPGSDIYVVYNDLSQTGLPADIFGRKDRQFVVKATYFAAAVMPASPEPGEGGRVRSSVRYAALTAASIAIAIVMTWPLARISPVALPASDDVYLSTWRLAWVAHQLPVDPLHLFDANIFHPEKGTLAYSDAMLLVGLFGLPFFKLGLDPGLIHNALLLAAIVSSMLCAFVLAHRLTGSAPASFIAAIVFGFAPYRMAHIGHLELQWTMWMPLGMLLLHRVMEKPSLSSGVQLGAALAAQALCSIYYGVFLACYLAVAWLALIPFESLKTRIVTASAAAVLPLLVVAAIYGPPYWRRARNLASGTMTKSRRSARCRRIT